jgi:uncharacterized protein DUF3179
LVPTIDGRLHHFTNAGLYDGLFTLYDAETHTLWNHMTGEAEYGPLVGRTLGPPGNQLQMNAKQALEEDSKTEIAISDRVYFAGGRQFGTASGIGPGGGGGRGRGAPDPNASMNNRFIPTLGKEDQRRPRMELGLGVWTGTTHRYYPVARIRERGGAFIDQLDGRTVLVYIDLESNTPAALFVKAASAKLQDRDVLLDNGLIVRTGVLLDRTGKRLAMERPQQIFTRWYGFALTFSGCEVFGG